MGNWEGPATLSSGRGSIIIYELPLIGLEVRIEENKNVSSNIFAAPQGTQTPVVSYSQFWRPTGEHPFRRSGLPLPEGHEEVRQTRGKLPFLDSNHLQRFLHHQADG